MSINLEKCDRCKIFGKVNVFNSNQCRLCDKCRKLWHEDCKVNGIIGGKYQIEEYKLALINGKKRSYWWFVYTKFIKMGKEVFIFR